MIYAVFTGAAAAVVTGAAAAGSAPQSPATRARPAARRLAYGLPGRIRMRRPARAARIVKQRGAAMDALKAHKLKRAPVCTREREHMRASTSTSALALADARLSTVSTIMVACDG